MLGVSRVTVREAFQQLEVAGYVSRAPGSGTKLISDRGAVSGEHVGLIIPDLSSEYFGEIADAFLKDAQQSGIETVVHVHNDDPGKFEGSIDSLMRTGVGGLAVVVPRNCTEACVRKLERVNIPKVLMMRKVPQAAVSQVIVDNIRVGELATNHMLDLGHTRVVCLAILDFPVGRERFVGYRQALEKRGLPFAPELAVDLAKYPNLSTAGHEAVRDLLAAEIPFTAIVAFNDRQAARALGALKQHRVAVPGDIGLIGTDDDDLGVYLGLSTVRVEWSEIGRLGASGLLAQLRPGVSLRPVISTSTISVVPRETCGYVMVQTT